MKKKNKHLTYYFSLSAVLFSGLALIFLASPNRLLQMLFLAGTSVCYVILGLVHHMLNHDLVGRIVVEYILVAALGIAAAFFIFRGGFGF